MGALQNKDRKNYLLRKHTEKNSLIGPSLKKCLLGVTLPVVI